MKQGGGILALNRRIKDVINLAEIRQLAIEQLLTFGVVIPFDNKIHLFHGRMSDKDEKFVVKTNFNNAGQTPDHYNVNAIPGMHASTFFIAEKYAQRRTSDFYSKQTKLPANLPSDKVYEIVGKSNNLMFIDVCKFLQIEELEPYLSNIYKIPQEQIEQLKKNILSTANQQKMQQVWSTLISTFTIPQLMPNLFNNEASSKIFKDLNKICLEKQKLNQPAVVTDNECEKYIAKRSKDNIPSQLIEDICGSINVYYMLKQQGGIATLVSKLQSDFNFTDNCTLNLNLFKSFLTQLNIIGFHQKIWFSEIVDEKNFDDYFIFDTSKINTKQMVKKQQKTNSAQTDAQVLSKKL